MKLKKTIYPVILVVFALINVAIFVYAARFLSGAINKSLATDEQLLESRLVKLDLVNFYLVAKKLSLSDKANNSGVSADGQTKK
jgi:hypothetical protein